MTDGAKENARVNHIVDGLYAVLVIVPAVVIGVGLSVTYASNPVAAVVFGAAMTGLLWCFLSIVVYALFEFVGGAIIHG